LFLGSLPTSLFFTRVDFLFDEIFFIRGGWLYNLFFVWWVGVVVAGHIRLLQALKVVSHIKRNQIQYFFLATALGFTGGAHAYFPKIGIDVYPWGIYGVGLYSLIMAYAILRFNLLDIRLFIRRAALMIFIYIVLILIAIPFIAIIHEKAVQGGVLSYSYLLFEVLLAGLILSGGPFLYAMFISKNQYFHRESMASLTHELKSPLSAIEGALDMLIYEAQKKADDPKQKEYLEMIDRNSARLRGFVDELLLVMKSGAKISRLNFEPVNMAELCREVMSTFEEAAKTKGNQLIFQGKESSHLNIDPAKIKKVLSNLLSNANKFTKDGAITVSLYEGKDHVKVQVADTGMGLAAGDLPYVFDTFYQTSVGKKAKGTGIGLSIAKLWVDSHGGLIGAESEGEGKGSLFWFTLPR
jgi:signal transduction histidine kinase